MSYFIYSKHEISGALLEYGGGRNIGNMGLTLRVQSDIHKLFIRLGPDAPWIYTLQVIDTTQWNHIGFSYHGDSGKLM